MFWFPLSYQFVHLPLSWSGVPEQYFDLPPLRSQGDLVTQPSQSKLDATIRCRFVAAFFNCPSITRPATEFYRDLKEKDAVISSVPKMRKKWGRFNYKRAQAQYASPDQECAQNDLCARNGFKNWNPHKGHFSLEYGQSGWWNLRVEDILIRACLPGHPGPLDIWGHL